MAKLIVPAGHQHTRAEVLEWLRRKGLRFERLDQGHEGQKGEMILELDGDDVRQAQMSVVNFGIAAFVPYPAKP